LSPGDGEIQASEQLGQGFAFSPYQHGQGVSSLVGHGDTFPDRKNDPDGDSSEFDYFIEVGQVWKIANAALSQSISWSKFGIQFAFFIELSSSDPNTCQNNQTQPT